MFVGNTFNKRNRVDFDEVILLICYNAIGAESECLYFKLKTMLKRALKGSSIMDTHELISWSNRVMNRQDLRPLVDNQVLIIEFFVESKFIFVLINGSNIRIETSHEEIHRPNLTIKANMNALRDLWNGKQRLLQLPSDEIEIVGRYRDVLLTESLFALGC